jgi:hypothetical protein
LTEKKKWKSVFLQDHQEETISFRSRIFSLKISVPSMSSSEILLRFWEVGVDLSMPFFLPSLSQFLLSGKVSQLTFQHLLHLKKASESSLKSGSC